MEPSCQSMGWTYSTVKFYLSVVNVSSKSKAECWKTLVLLSNVTIVKWKGKYCKLYSLLYLATTVIDNVACVSLYCEALVGCACILKWTCYRCYKIKMHSVVGDKPEVKAGPAGSKQVLQIFIGVRGGEGWGGVGECTLSGSSGGGRRRVAVWILGIPGLQRQDVCTGHAASDTDGSDWKEGGGRQRGEGGGGWGVASLAICQPLFVRQANTSKTHGGQKSPDDPSRSCARLFL